MNRPSPTVSALRVTVTGCVVVVIVAAGAAVRFVWVVGRSMTSMAPGERATGVVVLCDARNLVYARCAHACARVCVSVW